MKPLTLILSLPLLSIFLLTGCGAQNAIQMETPEETIDLAFTSLQELDMETFNACTNNKSDNHYRLFNELLQKRDKERYYPLAQALVENLSWEITSVQTNGDTAIVDMIIKNTDFSNAVGNFVADLITNINDSQREGVNLPKLITKTVNEARNSPKTLLPYLQNCQKEMTVSLSVTLKKVDNSWQIQLNDTLCNALTGNMGSEELSEDVEERIRSAEQLLNNNLERWGQSLEEKSETWSDQLESKLNTLFD